MEPVSSAMSIAHGILSQEIAQKGYGLLRRSFFPHRKYGDRLCQLIEETALEFEAEYPKSSDKVPFFQSQPLFDALNKYVLFTSLPDKSELVETFKEYPNVLPPTQQQLERFYAILTLKINNCEKLKKLHFEETYKEKIFDISDEILQFKLILQSLDEKLTFHLSNDWLNEKNALAIADLGGRYTPELNVKLDIAKVFEGVGRTQAFSDMDFPGFARHSKELKCNSKSGLKSLMSANTLKVGKNQMRFLSHNLPRLNGVLHSQVFVLH